MSTLRDFAQNRLKKWLEPELFQPFILGILCCLTLSEFVRGAMTLSMLPTYGRTVLGFAVEWTALALSIHYFADNLCRAVAGWLVDHFGQRIVLLTGFVIAVVALILMMHARSIWALIGSAALYGVGVTPMWPVAISGIGVASPEEKRASFMGYLYIFWLAGTGLGPVVINFVIDRTYRFAFWLLIGIEVAAFCLAFVFVRRPRRAKATVGAREEGTAGERVLAERALAERATSAREADAQPSASGSASVTPEVAVQPSTSGRSSAALATLSSPDGPANVGQSAGVAAVIQPGGMAVPHRGREYWRSMWKNVKSVAFLFPGMFAQTFAVASLVPVLSLYAKVVLHISGPMYSSILVAGGAFTVALLIPAGKLVDKLGMRRVLVPGFLLAGTMLGVYPIFHNVVATYVTVIILGCAYAFILPAWNAVLDRSIDKDKKGALWGVFMTVEGLGSACGPYVGGLVWDTLSPQAPFLVSGAVIFVMGLLYLKLPIERRVAMNAGGRTGAAREDAMDGSAVADGPGVVAAEREAVAKRAAGTDRPAANRRAPAGRGQVSSSGFQSDERGWAAVVRRRGRGKGGRGPVS